MAHEQRVIASPTVLRTVEIQSETMARRAVANEVTVPIAHVIVRR